MIGTDIHQALEVAYKEDLKPGHLYMSRSGLFYLCVSEMLTEQRDWAWPYFDFYCMYEQRCLKIGVQHFADYIIEKQWTKQATI